MPLTSADAIDIHITPATAGSFIPASGGASSFNSGSGGPDIGAFTARLNLAAPLTWSNMDSIGNITRANRLTVNWTGGDPHTYMTITGLSCGLIGNSTSDFVVGNFACYRAGSQPWPGRSQRRK
jgi:hypothetical protein